MQLAAPHRVSILKANISTSYGMNTAIPHQVSMLLGAILGGLTEWDAGEKITPCARESMCWQNIIQNISVQEEYEMHALYLKMEKPGILKSI